MQPEQRELLEQCRSNLLELSDVPGLAEVMVEKKIFTLIEVRNIFESGDELYNRERFFKELEDKEELAYNILIDWLVSSGHEKLARRLALQRHGTAPFCHPELERDEQEETQEIETSINSSLELPGTFDDSKVPLEVVVQLADEFRDTPEFNPNVSYYSSRSKKRGKVLIINNYDFTGTEHKQRTGAEVDEKNLKELFGQMGGWLIVSETNKTAEQMRVVLKQFARAGKKCDICLVIIMSHGSDELNETLVYGTDGKYLTATNIQYYFTNENCMLFRGKPKIFLYQVCRGNDVDFEKMYTEFDGKCNQAGVVLPPPITRNEVRRYCRPVDDMLIGFATMQGTKAHRDPYRGTWYIELICKHFMELAKYESFNDLLMKVDEGLRERKSELGTVQTAEHVCKGFRKLYLNPGIYEDNGNLKRFHPRKQKM